MEDIRLQLKEIEPPCRDCIPPERYVGCHSECKKYTEWRADRDKLLDKKHENLKVHDALTDIRYSYFNKTRKSKNLPK